MGYTRPQGTIQMFRSVPLTPNHDDVFSFSSNSDAYSKLSKNYESRMFSEETYTRTERGTLRVGLHADELLHYNYLCWKNIRANMYFFAFVTNIGYVNENCTEVTYVIDDYMTWFGFLQLGMCYVDREIPETDNMGEHTIDEAIDTGDLVNSFNTQYDFGEDLYYLFQSSTDFHGQPATTYVNGIQCPLKYTTRLVGYEITDIINYYHGVNPVGDTQENTNNPDNMVTVNIVPKFLADAVGQEGGISQDTYHFARERDLDGHIPKNNKLYCYPYSRICISNNAGTISEYKWELFPDGGSPMVDFEIIGTVMGNPTIMCYPILYEKVGKKYDSSIVMSNFPPVPWINDTYKAFIAQNKANIISSCIGLVGNFATNAIGVTTGASVAGATNTSAGSSAAMGSAASSAVAMTVSPVQGILGMIQEKKDHQFTPKTVANVAQGDMVMLLAKRLRLDFYNVTLKYEMAKSIDEFFSAFGYACHRVKKPNISSRTYWNYTKTNGCIITGTAPSQAKDNICRMFDRGVRIWHNPLYIGKFDLPNNINGQ